MPTTAAMYDNQKGPREETVLEVLKDVRSELRRLNQVAWCKDTQAIPHILRRIEKAVVK
jgi:hypothetical protein